MKLTTKELKILAELRENWEQEYRTGWGQVYLNNCTSAGTKEFSGTLASLEKKGLYNCCDNEDAGIFGEVKLQ